MSRKNRGGRYTSSYFHSSIHSFIYARTLSPTNSPAHKANLKGEARYAYVRLPKRAQPSRRILQSSHRTKSKPEPLFLRQAGSPSSALTTISSHPLHPLTPTPTPSPTPPTTHSRQNPPSPPQRHSRPPPPPPPRSPHPAPTSS